MEVNDKQHNGKADNYQADKLILFNWNGTIEDDSFTGEHSYRKKTLDLLRFFNCSMFENYSENSVFQYWTMHLEESLYLKDTMPAAFSWFHSVSNDFKLMCDYLQFTNKMKELYEEINHFQPMADLARDMKKFCKTGIIANMTLFDLPRYQEWCGSCGFDQEYLSCKLGISMPEKEFYQKVEEQCGISPQNILLIDVNQSNLDLAYERKWQTKLFLDENDEEVRQACKEFLM